MDHHLNYTGKSDYEIEWTPFSLTHVEFPKGIYALYIHTYVHR